jgi:hypothetical protein
MPQSRTSLGVLALIALFLSAFVGSLIQKESFSRDARDLKYYRDTMLRKQGASSKYGTYELLSFDGGKRWYAVERGPDYAVVIKGTAEEIFPGISKHLAAWDALVDHAMKNGPITLSGDRAPTDKALLEAAGFTVTKKQP